MAVAQPVEESAAVVLGIAGEVDVRAALLYRDRGRALDLARKRHAVREARDRMLDRHAREVHDREHAGLALGTTHVGAATHDRGRGGRIVGKRDVRDLGERVGVRIVGELVEHAVRGDDIEIAAGCHDLRAHVLPKRQLGKHLGAVGGVKRPHRAVVGGNDQRVRAGDAHAARPVVAGVPAANPANVARAQAHAREAAHRARSGGGAKVDGAVGDEEGGERLLACGKRTGEPDGLEAARTPRLPGRDRLEPATVKRHHDETVGVHHAGDGVNRGLERCLGTLLARPGVVHLELAANGNVEVAAHHDGVTRVDAHIELGPQLDGTGRAVGALLPPQLAAERGGLGIRHDAARGLLAGNLGGRAVIARPVAVLGDIRTWGISVYLDLVYRGLARRAPRVSGGARKRRVLPGGVVPGHAHARLELDGARAQLGRHAVHEELPVLARRRVIAQLAAVGRGDGLEEVAVGRIARLVGEAYLVEEALREVGHRRAERQRQLPARRPGGGRALGIRADDRGRDTHLGLAGVLLARAPGGVVPSNLVARLERDRARTNLAGLAVHEELPVLARRCVVAQLAAVE